MIRKRLRMSSPVAKCLPPLKPASIDPNLKIADKNFNRAPRKSVRSPARMNIRDFPNSHNPFKLSTKKLLEGLSSARKEVMSATLNKGKEDIRKIIRPMNFYEKISNSKIMNEHVHQRLVKLLNKQGLRCNLSEKIKKINTRRKVRCSKAIKKIMSRVVNINRMNKTVFSCPRSQCLK
ncbi:unnamed protein product [Moneuplotes crassus]|uniref:Uncharacterized protein n=1 Tax=Euplotes crassus TaxID=5936 RepID=A0AAD1U5U6_EUPCR|nr:unnamed protein product [Moneuplotes crassus]